MLRILCLTILISAAASAAHSQDPADVAECQHGIIVAQYHRNHPTAPGTGLDPVRRPVAANCFHLAMQQLHAAVPAPPQAPTKAELTRARSQRTLSLIPCVKKLGAQRIHTRCFVDTSRTPSLPEADGEFERARARYDALIDGVYAEERQRNVQSELETEQIELQNSLRYGFVPR